MDHSLDQNGVHARLFAGLIALTVAAGSAWANSLPVVSNVTANQRNDGSKLVNISYDLADADSNACAVTVVASDDDGTTWAVPISTFLPGSDVGSAITPGANRLIVWDTAIDLPGVSGNQFKIRLWADDGNPPQGMVLVPASDFQMGSPWSSEPDEHPLHPVYLSPYYIDTFEITNQQYVSALNWAKNQGNLITVTNYRVYKYNSGTSYPYCDTKFSFIYSHITWNGSNFRVVSGKGSHPMVRVSWYGAAAYCNWRSAMEGKSLCYDLSNWTCNFGSGYRLPTEAEWEKAAAWDPVQQRHYRYSNHTDGCGLSCLDGQSANFYLSGDPFEPGESPDSTPAGFYNGELHDQVLFGWPGPQTSYQTQHSKSYYGCYDMSGNVAEWCHDWYSGTYYSSSSRSDPIGPATGLYRVLRGGAWYSPEYHCKSAERRYDGGTPANRDYGIGFRCALGTLPLSQADSTSSPAFTINNRAAADLDGDGDKDLDDWAILAGCLAGPGTMTPPPGCAAAAFAQADFDGDLDVDLADFAWFGDE